jgi:hypothetical protein
MVKCTTRQIRQLKTTLHWKMPEAQQQRIQMILLRESGMAQPAIADAMGVSLSTVNRAHMAHDRGDSSMCFTGAPVTRSRTVSIKPRKRSVHVRLILAIVTAANFTPKRSAINSARRSSGSN